MIVDFVLDRKEGFGYSKEEFLDYCMAENEAFGFCNDVIYGLETDNEEVVKEALCRYIHDNCYNMAICFYINSVNWTEGE